MTTTTRRRRMNDSLTTHECRSLPLWGPAVLARAMIGVSHPRLGGDRLVAGAGRFVADVRVPGLLEAAVLRSRHAHARLIAVDATRALALPGVRLVLTAADVPENAVIPNRVPVPPAASGTCSRPSPVTSFAMSASRSLWSWPRTGTSPRTRWS